MVARYLIHDLQNDILFGLQSIAFFASTEIFHIFKYAICVLPKTCYIFEKNFLSDLRNSIFPVTLKLQSMKIRLETKKCKIYILKVCKLY